MAGERSVVVIGAGAAGLMAAIFAARAGARVRLLERTRDGGRKILISGGGRCNVLPPRLDETRFVTDSSPHTLRKMLRSWPLADQIAFFRTDLGIPLEEETESGKLFPVSNRARDVRDGLLAGAVGAGAEFLPDTMVTGLEPGPGGWRVHRRGAAPIGGDAVVVATGGLSVPNTGSDGVGLEALRRLGHHLHPTYPALTPITTADPRLLALAGISLPVSLNAEDGRRRASASGGFLFTHRGYSGPAVLDVSHVLVRARLEGRLDARLRVRWGALDPQTWRAALEPTGRGTVGPVVRSRLPDRLAAVLLELAEIDPGRQLAQLTRDQRRGLLAVLTEADLPWTGDEGYRKAEVTGGGVSLSEVDPRTLESRRCPGLFLAGEVLDAFGPIGGYNFAWAWATGRAAGQGSARPGS